MTILRHHNGNARNQGLCQSMGRDLLPPSVYVGFRTLLLWALGAQPRRRKPAFVTHYNEASLCVGHCTPPLCKIWGAETHIQQS